MRAGSLESENFEKFSHHPNVYDTLFTSEQRRLADKLTKFGSNLQSELSHPFAFMLYGHIKKESGVIDAYFKVASKQTAKDAGKCSNCSLGKTCHEGSFLHFADIHTLQETVAEALCVTEKF
jgi:hypothetical protein